MVERKVTGSPIQVGSRGVGEVSTPIPPGTPPALRRFWKTARELAGRFSKHLMKDRTEEFLKVVSKDFEDNPRKG